MEKCCHSVPGNVRNTEGRDIRVNILKRNNFMQKSECILHECQLLIIYELTVTFGFTARKSRAFSSSVRNLRDTLKAYLL